MEWPPTLQLGTAQAGLDPGVGHVWGLRSGSDMRGPGLGGAVHGDPPHTHLRPPERLLPQLRGPLPWLSKTVPRPVSPCHLP